MTRSPRRRRSAGVSLVLATVLTALATQSAPAAVASNLPAPDPAVAPIPRPTQDNPLHLYTLTVLSIYTHDDGDPGVYGPGDVNFVKLRINGDNNFLYIDNGNPWHYGLSNREWQHYNSDTGYLAPPKLDFNLYQDAATVGSTIHVEGIARELDNFLVNATIAVGTKNVLLPPAGSAVDAVVMIEGKNGQSHVRLAVTYRLTTY